MLDPIGVLTDGKYQPTLIGGMGIYLAGETPARTDKAGETPARSEKER